MNMNDASKNQDIAIVQKALDGLGEHFDTVHIFCTRYDPVDDGATVHLQRGTGNWFARYGQIRNWLEMEKGATRANGAKSQEPDA